MRRETPPRTPTNAPFDRRPIDEVSRLGEIAGECPLPTTLRDRLAVGLHFELELHVPGRRVAPQRAA